MVKASFWTDPELLRWPRDKRWFYQGLWEAAEDSGCIEDDPFGWKLLLFPSPMDADITVAVLTQYRHELVEAGKLIPYEAGGKQYAYLANFHQHERPRNPQSPDLPLPPWVSYKTNANDGRKLRYEVDEAALAAHLEGCTTVVQGLYNDVTTPPAQPCPVLSCPVQSNTVEVGVRDKTPESLQQAQTLVESSTSPPTPPPEQSKTKEKRHKPHTCDEGEPCEVLLLRGVRKTVARIDPVGLEQIDKPGTSLGGALARLVAFLCSSAQDILPALDRKQREQACQRMLQRALERMTIAHAKTPIRSLPRYVNGCVNRACLGDVIGDDLLEELRREASALYGARLHREEPVSIGAALAGAGRSTLKISEETNG